MTQTYEYKMTKKSWNEYFKEYKDSRAVSSPIIKNLERTLELFDKNNKVLDAGCGSGNYSKYISSKGFEVLGIDYSSEAIKVANEKPLEKNNMKFMCMKLDERLPFADNSFDLVVCINTLHCLYGNSRAAALKELKRVLKNNGVIFLSVLSDEDKYMPRTIMTKLDEETYKDKWSEKVYAFYSKEKLLDLLKEFELINFETVIEERLPDLPNREEHLHLVTIKKKL